MKGITPLEKFETGPPPSIPKRRVVILAYQCKPNANVGPESILM